VSQWLYAENADAAGLLANTGKGSSDVKQKAVCAWCHPNPGVARAGTGEARHNDNLEPADVHGDLRSGATASYLQYWTGMAGSGTGTNDTAATFSAATDSCSSTKCHNNNATPSGATNWLTPPAWTTTGCDNTQCHASPRAASGTHLTHYQAKSYACSQCHAVPATLGHADGKVNLSFTGTLSGLTAGAFYDKDASGTSTPGDNAFAAFGTATSTCANVYCHVGKTTPAWNGTIAADACTACHTAGGAGTNPTSGLHTGPLTVSGNPHDDGWRVTKNEVTPTGT
jgi:predicted CxxxxCH...CXXCH cytochrome family protein